MDTKLAQHFTYTKLLKFVFPSIVMMIFTSIYSVVDGLLSLTLLEKQLLLQSILLCLLLWGLPLWDL